MHRPGVLRQYSDRVRITSQTTTSRSIERFASDDVDDSTHDEDSERPMLDSRWSITSRCRRPNRYCRHTRKEPVAERHALQPWMRRRVPARAFVCACTVLKVILPETHSKKR